MSKTIKTFNKFLPCVLAITIGMGLVACSNDEPVETVPEVAVPTKVETQIAQAAQASQASQVALAALSVEELRSRARTAFQEQRLYSPAGDNATEYYLALRKKSDKPDPNSESALMDLMPYTVIAAEQSIGRFDFVEAERLRALMERSDPQAPALPRIAEAIKSGKANAAQRAIDDAKQIAETKRLADLAKQKALDDASKLTTSIKTTPTTATAPITRVPAPISTVPTSTAPVVTPVTTAKTSTALVAISTPQPAYPPEALRGGITGSVEVEFTVNKDGSVSDVRVLKAIPRGAFERTVQGTVRKWQFQPVSEPRTMRRSFNFN